jgi:hypothetical protein
VFVPISKGRVIEFLHQAPTVDGGGGCVGTQHAVHAELRRADPERADRVLWSLSVGRPRQAIGQLGLVPLARAGAGVYCASPSFRLWLVVISVLPDQPHATSRGRTPDSVGEAGKA